MEAGNKNASVVRKFESMIGVRVLVRLKDGFESIGVVTSVDDHSLVLDRVNVIMLDSISRVVSSQIKDGRQLLNE